MTSSLQVTPVTHPQEAQQLGEILDQCFNIQEWDEYRDFLGLENFRIIYQNGTLAGGLCIYFMGQWWGGKSIPVAGLASVGIAPEYRGGGVALELLRQTLREVYDQQIPLSILYPATQQLYRRVGYEQAGFRCVWELPLGSLNPRPPVLPLHKINPLEPESLIPLYHQYASQFDGYLDRNSACWKLILRSQSEPFYGYYVGSLNQPEGYLIVEPRKIKDDITLLIRDWASLTPEATQSIFSFLASHRSQIKTCRWFGGLEEPRFLLLPEQTAQLIHQIRWFMRIINVTQALELRPYPLSLETELHLSITDDLLPENNDHFILSVSQGQGQVQRGGRGEFRIDIRELAPLYTGLITAQKLQWLGKLEAIDSSLKIANQIFLTATPAMPDFF